MRRFLKVQILAGILLAGAVGADAALQHRYSFDTDASDSVGGAHGTLMGTAGYFNDGMVELLGGPINDTNSYVSLPGAAIGINTYTQVTLQAWFRFDAVAGAYQKLFAFGGTQTTPGLEWAGRQYLIAGLRQADGGPCDAAISNAPEGDGDPWTEEANVVGPVLAAGLHHLAVVVDDTIIAIYVDGVLIQTDLLSSGPNLPSLDQVSTDLAYLGRSVYADALMGGGIDEFRIHDTALSSLDIGIDYALGAGDATGDPGTASGQTVVGDDTLVVESAKQYQLTVEFSKLPNPVTFNQDPGLTWTSSDPAIASVSEAGILVGKGTGTVTLTATYDGVPTTKMVTVTDRALVHQYSFNGAADSNFDFIEPDLVGTADGTVFYAERLGDGTLSLDSGLSGYVDLPNGIISPLGSATFETWVTPREVGLGWQRIWDFGTTTLGELDEFTLSGYNGTDFIFLTARRGDSASLSFEYSGAQNVILGPGYTFGEELHLVVTYNTDAEESILYLNGIPIGSDSGTPLMGGLPDVNNWLGRSQYANDGFLDALFDEFRVYEGVLSPLEVAVNNATGANGAPFTDPGASVTSVALTADPTSLLAEGEAVQAYLHADFTHVSGVPANGLDGVTFFSENTNVVTVTASGMVDPVGAGTVVVWGEFMGQSNSVTFVVDAIVKPISIVHHWGFNDLMSSTTVTDSVGTAHGTIIGTNHQFTGTALDLYGGGFSADAGPTSTVAGVGSYVDLPNGLVSSLSAAATFEIWYTWDGEGGNWQRVFDFGVDDDRVEDVVGTGAENLFLTPSSGDATIRTAVATNAPGYSHEFQFDGPAPITGEPVHVVFTWDSADSLGRMYVNGVRVDASTGINFALSQIPDLNNWLGRAQYNDPMFNGKLHELAIYNGIMTTSEVLANYAAGPGEAPVEGPMLDAMLSGMDLILMWTDATETFSVESAPALLDGADTVWTDAGLTPVDTNGQKQVTIPLNAEEGHYRLSD